jgi:anti-sigma B factor antagonist
VRGELDIQPMVTVVTLHGELDMLTVDSLRRLLDAACLGDPDRVVVDLTDVPFVDVLSLSTILATADALREKDAVLTVVGASSAVRRICALLNADDVLVPMLPMPRAAAN